MCVCGVGGGGIGRVFFEHFVIGAKIQNCIDLTPENSGNSETNLLKF